MDRSLLQAALEAIVSNVYFQPPADVSLEYPCIVYKRDNASTDFAGNLPYRYHQRYLVTHISRSPDSVALAKIAALPMCLYNRYFSADQLHHDAHILYH